jgi:hypothetical protein
LQASSLIEFLDAAVDTKFVQGPYEERGGIMLVAYPGSLKSTILRAGMQHHPDAMVVSDLNVQQWLKIREDFVTGRFSALGFTDFEKLYQRHSSTASHIEGIVKGLVAEGYGVGPSGDTRMPVIPAYALVCGAMTNSCLEAHYDEWSKSGFLRRFIWVVFSVKNQNRIAEAIRQWEKIDLGKISVRPANRQIQVNITAERTRQMERMMREQSGFNGPGYVLLKKIVAVLEWKYGSNGGPKRVTAILEDLAPGFSKNGGMVIL